MEIKINVQLTTKQMFEFLMYHTYSTFAGIIALVLSIGGYVGFFYMFTVPNVSLMYQGALLLIGLLFTVIQPYMIYSKAKKQVKQSEAVNKPLEYVINEEGISITQEENKAFTAWSEIVKIKSSFNIHMFYTSRFHAYVIPKAVVAERKEDLKKLVDENCNAYYKKL